MIGTEAVVTLTLADVHKYRKHWFRMSGKVVLVKRQLKNGLFLVVFEDNEYKLPKRNLTFLEK